MAKKKKTKKTKKEVKGQLGKKKETAREKMIGQTIGYRYDVNLLPDYKRLTPFLKKYIEAMGWDDLNWLEDVHMGYEECELRQTPRATEPNPELGVVEPETARRPGMIELGTWVKGDTVELRWEKPDERKGKEATGKVGENTTALLRQGKRIPCQLTRP
jgi:hypothetical protein